MNGTVFLAGSLIFHLGWIGLLYTGFGRPAAWMVALAVPYIGAPFSIAYVLKFWKDSGLWHRLFGTGYTLGALLVVMGVYSGINGAGTIDGAAEPGSRVSTAEESTAAETATPEVSPEDQQSMMAMMEAEMEKQTLAANLQMFRDFPENPDGEWARIAGNALYELVRLSTEGEVVEAVRLTADSRVPEGEVTWTADLTTGKVRIRVARDGFEDPKWISGAVSHASSNRISFLPLYDEETHRPFADGHDMQMTYIPKPQPEAR